MHVDSGGGFCVIDGRAGECQTQRRIQLSTLPTEAVNSRTVNLDQLSSLGVVRALQREDNRVAGAVRRCAGEIARAIEAMLPRVQAGGRVIYVGAGTSGRMGALDAAEIPPTFGVPARLFVAVIAGGRKALTRAVEGAEDDASAGAADVARLGAGRLDTVIGIAASGRTPYTVAALREAKRRGSLCVAVACVTGSPLARAANFAIEPLTGAEAVAGSTRLKAATAQKMVLNQISTGLMVRSGRVRGNLMVYVQATNRKLKARAKRIEAALAAKQ